MITPSIRVPCLMTPGELDKGISFLTYILRPEENRPFLSLGCPGYFDIGTIILEVYSLKPVAMFMANLEQEKVWYPGQVPSPTPKNLYVSRLPGF